jgi:cytoskeletal protein CcmA (bactofilin family)
MAKDDASTAINSILGPGSVFAGNLKVEGGLRVDGRIEGEVDVTGTLTIGHEGFIKGQVSVAHGIIGGSVSGTIRADKQLELQNGSKVEGDIFTRSLVIEEGVFFEGRCSMRNANAAPPDVENV